MIYDSLPHQSGIYIFKNSLGVVLYVGKAIDLKRRVSSYFQNNLVSGKTASMVTQIASIETIRTNGEFEALLLEAKLIKQYLPKYNVVARDDKHPLYIKITKQEYPKIVTSRKEENDNAYYFGPFPSSRVVKETLRFLRKIFPYCTEKSIGKRPCFYSHIGLCNPCPNYIETTRKVEKSRLKRLYKNNIKRIVRMLQNKSFTIIRELEHEMNIYSKQEMFKEAGVVKKQIADLTYLINQRFSPSSYLDNPNLVNDIRDKELTDISKLLSIPIPTRIEGYDISNTMGKQATSSMVVFINGSPDNSMYRRFRIRFKNTPDDYAMITETLIRRFSHKEWGKPDLLLVDGGAGQVRCAEEICSRLSIHIPIIGLAKRMEELIVPQQNGKYKTILIPIGSPALSLIMRIRDEAHRFARNYHVLLRKKAMLY